MLGKWSAIFIVRLRSARKNSSLCLGTALRFLIYRALKL